MFKDYPRLNKQGSGAVFRKTCMKCGVHRNVKRLRTPCIEVSCFRGDDIVLNTCTDCTAELTVEEALKLDEERRKGRKQDG